MSCPVCGVVTSRGASACIRHMHTAARARRARKCAACETSFVPANIPWNRAAKYCSRACYYAVAGLRPAMIEVACALCGVVLRRTQAAVKRHAHSFCSTRCQHEFNTRENNASWRGGNRAYRGPGWRRLAEEIRERDGYRCRRCGKHQDDEGTRLSVDHIIPFRSFDDAAEANAPANLVSLCRSCHAKKARAETAWLKGDVLDMWSYQIAVSQPWTKS